MIASLCLLFFGFAAGVREPQPLRPLQRSAQESHLAQNTEVEKNSATAEVREVLELEDAAPEEEEPTVPWSDYPNMCETFTVIEGAKRFRNPATGKLQYPIRHKRNRFHRKRSDQRRTRELIRLVTREMGADRAAQYLVDMIAFHESSWNPEAIHILNRDLQANLDAWEHFSYDPVREERLEEKIRTTSAKSKGYWKLRAQLADVQLYKGNPYWDSQLEYRHRIPERKLHGEVTEALEVTERRSVWAYGYGLFGMNSVLYMHVFDQTAPPWVLCGDEGIVAVVTAVWALREQQSSCAYLSGKDPDKYGTDGGNARGVVRRFARGHCSDSQLGPIWRRLMASDRYAPYIDYEKAPDFGHKFPRHEMTRRNGKLVYVYETERDPDTGETLVDEDGDPVYRRDGRGRKVKIPADRQAILEHMRKVVAEQGLFREQPLERKVPQSEPVISGPAGQPLNTAAP